VLTASLDGPGPLVPWGLNEVAFEVRQGHNQRVAERGESELFVDPRGTALRITWHADDAVAVVSLWRDDECLGTVRLPPEEAARLARLLEPVSVR